MIELDCIQGSAEWDEARLGVVTASCFERIITPKTLKLSAQRTPYLYELLAEWALGYREESFGGTAWTERGHEYEQEARDAIALVTDAEMRKVGFCYRDERRLVGCSPDALCGDSGGAEIKCPMGKQHLAALMAGGLPDEHRIQVQASMWVTGREWWIFSSYHPELPALVIKVEPDPKVFEAFDKHIPAFIEELESAKAHLAEKGFRK